MDIFTRSLCRIRPHCASSSMHDRQWKARFALKNGLFSGQHKGRVSSIRFGSDGQPGIEHGDGGGWRPQERPHGAVALLWRSLPLRAGLLCFPGGVLGPVILILLFIGRSGIVCERFLALYFHVSLLPLSWILLPGGRRQPWGCTSTRARQEQTAGAARARAGAPASRG